MTRAAVILCLATLALNLLGAGRVIAPPVDCKLVRAGEVDCCGRPVDRGAGEEEPLPADEDRDCRHCAFCKVPPASTATPAPQTVPDRLRRVAAAPAVAAGEPPDAPAVPAVPPPRAESRHPRSLA